MSALAGHYVDMTACGVCVNKLLVRIHRCI